MALCILDKRHQINKNHRVYDVYMQPKAGICLFGKRNPTERKKITKNYIENAIMPRRFIAQIWFYLHYCYGIRLSIGKTHKIGFFFLQKNEILRAHKLNAQV